MVSLYQTICCKTWGPRNKAHPMQVDFTLPGVVDTGGEVMVSEEPES